jgi:dephospho-CoA kinase
MILLGLTGNIACGKSTVARMLQARGAQVIDADLLVRELYANPHFSRRVAALFADRVLEKPLLTTESVVDRTALGAFVFSNPDALLQLESLVHPAVATLRAQKIAALTASTQPPAVVLEAVKLIESGQARACDVVWWISCDKAVQMQRLMGDRGLSATASEARLAQQPSAEQKRALLDDVPLVVIENNGSLDELQARVDEEWRKLAPDAHTRILSTRKAFD